MELPVGSMSFEILDGALVFLRCLPRPERTEIPLLPSLGILMTRIQSILTGFEFPNHRVVAAFDPQNCSAQSGNADRNVSPKRYRSSGCSIAKASTT